MSKDRKIPWTNAFDTLFRVGGSTVVAMAGGAIVKPAAIVIDLSELGYDYVNLAQIEVDPCTPETPDVLCTDEFGRMTTYKAMLEARATKASSEPQFAPPPVVATPESGTGGVVPTRTPEEVQRQLDEAKKAAQERRDALGDQAEAAAGNIALGLAAGVASIAGVAALVRRLPRRKKQNWAERGGEPRPQRQIPHEKPNKHTVAALVSREINGIQHVDVVTYEAGDTRGTYQATDKNVYGPLHRGGSAKIINTNLPVDQAEAKAKELNDQIAAGEQQRRENPPTIYYRLRE